MTTDEERHRDLAVRMHEHHQRRDERKARFGPRLDEVAALLRATDEAERNVTAVLRRIREEEWEAEEVARREGRRVRRPVGRDEPEHADVLAAIAAAVDAHGRATSVAFALLEDVNADPLVDRTFTRAFRLAQTAYARSRAYRDHVNRMRGWPTVPDEPHGLGELLRAMRLAAPNGSYINKPGLTLAELGQRIGLTEGAIRHIESGRTQPPLDRVAAWAGACGMRFFLRFDSTGETTEVPDPMSEIIDTIALMPEDCVRAVRDLMDAWNRLPEAIRWDIVDRFDRYATEIDWGPHKP